ncbi:kinase-like domain-containing protein [Gigaspora rosea]|uniref:Kinase-like domain-containing protein n=1 Tax=Gigaspora rosea TaxID=44941 RepID=A0A397UZ33_9GLOM|nr:kinase-like domain-containing protein [Gigaspora rosea]
MGCVSSKETRQILVPSKFCPNCRKLYTQRNWCKPCESRRFSEDFHNWTSGNTELDQFIRYTQLNSIAPLTFLEWIPYDKLEKIKEIGKGGFGIVYKATWNPGPKLYWDDLRSQWVRESEKNVALKRLNGSNHAVASFWQELRQYHCINQNDHIRRCYGFSRDPKSKDYIIVSELIEGDLYNYLSKNFNNLTWEKKLGIVYNIAHGLMTIHNAGFIHRNFHSGNILRCFNGSQHKTLISDLGQYRPPDKPISHDEHCIYGVLPYVAPEVLCGFEYTEAADVYSFGMVMWEISTGQHPFHDRPHDEKLAWEICNGLRPALTVETPRCFMELMESCWDANPKRRPDIRELEKIFMSWGWHMGISQKHEVFDQFISAENERQRLLKSDESEAFKKPHPEAIYKSRLLKFPELPKPVNRSSCLRTSAERSSFFFSGYEEMLLYKPINTYDSYERVESREISFPVSDEDLAISFDNISSV